MNFSMRCKYYLNEFAGWCMSHKVIVVLSLLSFSLFVSALVLGGQKSRLQTQVADLKAELAAATSTTVPPTGAQTEAATTNDTAPTDAPTAVTNSTEATPENEESQVDPEGNNGASSENDEGVNGGQGVKSDNEKVENGGTLEEAAEIKEVEGEDSVSDSRRIHSRFIG